jgi:hypothetical protein
MIKGSQQLELSFSGSGPDDISIDIQIFAGAQRQP